MCVGYNITRRIESTTCYRQADQTCKDSDYLSGQVRSLCYENPLNRTLVLTTIEQNKVSYNIMAPISAVLMISSLATCTEHVHVCRTDSWRCTCAGRIAGGARVQDG